MIPLKFQPEKCILHRSGIPLTSSGTRDHGVYNTGYLKAFYHKRISQAHSLQLKYSSEGINFSHEIRLNSVMMRPLKYEFTMLRLRGRTLARHFVCGCD